MPDIERSLSDEQIQNLLETGGDINRFAFDEARRRGAKNPIARAALSGRILDASQTSIARLRSLQTKSRASQTSLRTNLQETRRRSQSSLETRTRAAIASSLESGNSSTLG